MNEKWAKYGLDTSATLLCNNVAGTVDSNSAIVSAANMLVTTTFAGWDGWGAGHIWTMGATAPYLTNNNH